MKKVYIFITIVSLSTMLIAQKTFEYAYDNAGNRILRHTVELRSMQSFNHNDSSTIQESTALGEMKITVMPNPTAGKLQISITNLPDNAIGGIIVWDLQSKEILRQEGIFVNNTLDLGVQPKGIYLMQIRVGNKKSEWKVVKE